MERSIRELKTRASRAMAGNYGILVMAYMINMIISSVVGNLSARLFGGIGAANLVLEQSVIFIVTLLLAVVTTGIIGMHLTLSRGGKTSIGDMFSMFHQQPDRILIAALIFGALEMIFMIPTLVLANMINYTTDTDRILQLGGYLGIASVAAVIAITLVTLPFSLCFYLLADHPDMTGVKSLKTSVQLMKGNNLRFLLLQLSFTPLFLLCIITCGIGFLWLIPYMNMTYAMFYKDIIGELDQEDLEAQMVESISEPVVEWAQAVEPVNVPVEEEPKMNGPENVPAEEEPKMNGPENVPAVEEPPVSKPAAENADERGIPLAPAEDKKKDDYDFMR